MISKSVILSRLSPFKNEKKIILKEQTTNDIINGILSAHSEFRSEYDKIYKFFDSESVEGIGLNIFNFIKKNIPYKAESEHFQKLNSPQAALQGSGDCKTYALFVAGIIDAFNRNENEKIPFSFRFAGYNSKDLEHVFIVIYPLSSNEIWIDNVLNFFDERKIPYFYIDKKVKPMALYKVSGINEPGRIGLDPLSVVSIFSSGGLFDTVADMFDNSSRRWKSRTKKMKDLSPNEMIIYYTQQLNSTGDLYWIAEYKRVWGDAAGWGAGYWDYLTTKGSQAAQSVDLSLAEAYNKSVSNAIADKPDFLKGKRNLAFYKNDISSGIDDDISGGGNTLNSGGGSLLGKAAAAAALYFLFK